jgi:hypothetical protein
MSAGRQADGEVADVLLYTTQERAVEIRDHQDAH